LPMLLVRSGVFCGSVTWRALSRHSGLVSPCWAAHGAEVGPLLTALTHLPAAWVQLEQRSWAGNGCAVGSSRYSNKNVSTLKWLYGFNYSVVFFKNKTKTKTNL